MTRGENRMLRGLGVAVLTGLLSLAPEVAHAQEQGARPSANPRVDANPTVAEKEHAPGGPTEGIRVHGHWTIVVRNPDGTVASRHEFENALVSDGATVLAQLLGRQVTPIYWTVELYVPGSKTPDLYVYESVVGPSTSPALLTGLTVSVPSSGTNAGKLVLSGTVPGTSTVTYPAGTTGQLTNVGTILAVTCGGAVPCTSSNGKNSAIFSGRDLTKAVPPATTAPPPIYVQSGQAIDFTVVFSFQ